MEKPQTFKDFVLNGPKQAEKPKAKPKAAKPKGDK